MGIVSEPIFFSLIKKGEGSKRKLITLHNDDDLRLQARIVDVLKPEWIEVEGLNVGVLVEFEANEKRRYVVNVNATHRFFPDTRVLDEEVVVKLEEDMQFVIPITIQEVIDEVTYYRGVFSVDFGTTNSCYAWKNRFDPQGNPADAFAPARTSHEIPTLLYFKDVSSAKSPKFKIGIDAQHDIKEFAGRNYAYFIGLKRLIGQQRDFVVLDDRMGSTTRQVYTVEELASFFIDDLLDRAEEDLGDEKITQVIATYPTLYSTRKKDRLRRAFELALERRGVDVGSSSVQIKLDEANAAAFNYIYGDLLDEFRRLDITSSNNYVLTFDMGGGTIDVSLLHAAIRREDIRLVMDIELRGVTGEPYWAGDNVTLEVFRLLKPRLAIQIAHERLVQAKADAAAAAEDADIWAQAGKREEEEDVDWFQAGAAEADDDGPSIDDLLAELGVDLPNDEDPSTYMRAAETVDTHAGVIQESILQGVALADVLEEACKSEGVPFNVQLVDEIEEAIETLVPTKFSHYTDAKPHREAAAKELFYELWHEANTLKLLCVAAHDGTAKVSQVLRRVATYARVDPKVFNDKVGITRQEMDARIGDRIRAAMLKAKALYLNALDDAGDQKIVIGGQREAAGKVPLKLLLAGNSARLPLVRELVDELFQLDAKDISYEPKRLKKAVAQGAAEDSFLEREFGGGGGLISANTTGFLERFPYSIGLYHRDLTMAGYKDGFCPIFRRGQGCSAQAVLDERNNFLIHEKVTDLAVYANYHDDAVPTYIGRFDFRTSVPEDEVRAMGATLKTVEPAEAREVALDTDEAEVDTDAWDEPLTEPEPEEDAPYSIRFEVLPSRQVVATVLQDNKHFLLQWIDRPPTEEENPLSGAH